MALSFGLVHAFDADHIAAVTGLSLHKNNFRRSLQFCLRWALGHGGVLIILALIVFGFKVQIPEQVGRSAELLAGTILLFIGILLIRQILQQRIYFSIHQHDDATHAHLHHHHHQRLKDHSATLVGVVHGLAGSAPVLVLIPLTEVNYWWQVVFYVLVFSSGVVLAMLIFGGVLSQSLQRAQRYGQHLVTGLRSFAAILSLVIGTRLILSTMGVL